MNTAIIRRETTAYNNGAVACFGYTANNKVIMLKYHPSVNYLNYREDVKAIEDKLKQSPPSIKFEQYKFSLNKTHRHLKNASIVFSKKFVSSFDKEIDDSWLNDDRLTAARKIAYAIRKRQNDKLNWKEAFVSGTI